MRALKFDTCLLQKHFWEEVKTAEFYHFIHAPNKRRFDAISKRFFCVLFLPDFLLLPHNVFLSYFYIFLLIKSFFFSVCIETFRQHSKWTRCGSNKNPHVKCNNLAENSLRIFRCLLMAARPTSVLFSNYSSLVAIRWKLCIFQHNIAPHLFDFIN